MQTLGKPPIKVDATTKLSMDPPKLLMLKLKRYNLEYKGHSRELSKITKECEVNDTLTLQSDPEVQYDLAGVSIHTGTFKAGHYYTYKKLPTGQWLKCNDDTITEVTEVKF